MDLTQPQVEIRNFSWEGCITLVVLEQREDRVCHATLRNVALVSIYSGRALLLRTCILLQLLLYSSPPPPTNTGRINADILHIHIHPMHTTLLYIVQEQHNPPIPQNHHYISQINGRSNPLPPPGATITLPHASPYAIGYINQVLNRHHLPLVASTRVGAGAGAGCVLGGRLAYMPLPRFTCRLLAYCVMIDNDWHLGAALRCAALLSVTSTAAVTAAPVSLGPGVSSLHPRYLGVLCQVLPRRGRL